MLIALELPNATALVGAALGAAGVVGVALGFAFRDIMENYLAGLLLNYTRNPLRRLDFEVSVEVNEDLLTAQKLVSDTLASMQAVHAEPPPLALLERLEDSCVPIRLVKTAFDEANIQMPEPIYQIYMRSEAKSPAQQVVHLPAESLASGDTASVFSSIPIALRGPVCQFVCVVDLRVMHRLARCSSVRRARYAKPLKCPLFEATSAEAAGRKSPISEDF